MRRRVLVADNNADLAQVLGEFIRMDSALEFMGYVVTGEAAFDAAQSGRIDVLVLDLGLGDCHGLEVLGRLKTAGSPTRVVIHSGYSSAELEARAKLNGAAGYVVKDGNIETLLAAIRAA